MSPGDVFGLLSGGFWSLTYILLIWVGFKHKTYGMPLFALCANLSWEFTYSFVHPLDGWQEYVDIAWFFFDVAILATYVRYGRKHYSPHLPKWSFYPNLAVTLGLTTVLIYLGDRLDRDLADAYMAFLQNLMMSVLFVAMVLQRGSTEGQSPMIATCKMVGTACATLMVTANVQAGVVEMSEAGLSLIQFVGLACFACDVIYLALLLFFRRRESAAAQ